ncbi:MAG: hypothetical protein K2M42_10705 [Oscillospiraceae bacterium]|nr:hypothetical protein [Oscillospiraceae bacterium]
MTKKAINAAFVGLILVLLLAGLGRTVFLPKEINTYENRYAEKLAPLTLSGWLDGSFQDSVDAALSDQVQLAEIYKKVFHRTSSYYLKAAADPILSRCEGQYVNYMGILVFNRYITYSPRSLSALTQPLEKKADNYNEYFAAHPELDFYVYFIEKDTDINFETGEKVPACDYLFDRLELEPDRLGRFAVDSFDEFSTWFYRTDHHWNLNGSYRGYTQLLELLGAESAPLRPTGDAAELGTFSGSKAIGITAAFREPFLAYPFEFPHMDVTVSGYPGDYGAQDAFFAGQGGAPSYGAFYGWDSGEVVFSTGQTGRENLLVLGESYDNAVLKLLASHFNNTYSVDLRYYEAYMGKPFSFTDYVKEHDITQVLLIGNIDYFIMDEFLLEG